MHFVRNARYVDGYRLLLTFEDGSTRLVDLGPHLDGEIFEPLKDVDYFLPADVTFHIDTTCWENGADMSPDFLYAIGERTTEDHLTVAVAV